MSAPNGTGQSSILDSMGHPVAPVQVAQQTFKFKYKEANPAPEGADPVLWNKCFTAADSRLYNNYGKKAEKSQKCRASGETRVLALKLFQERLAKEAERTSTPRTSTPNTLTASSSTPNFTTNTTEPVQTPLIDPATSSTVLLSPNTFTNPATASTSLPQTSAPETNAQNSTSVKMERSSSRDATPAPFVFGSSSNNDAQASFSFTEQAPSIADNVKGKGRKGKGPAPKDSSQLPGFGPTSIGYANKRKFDDPQLSDAEKTKWVDEKLESMTIEEIIDSPLLKVAMKDDVGTGYGGGHASVEEAVAAKAAELFAARNALATPPVVDEDAKPSKAKKKREARKKSAAAARAAEAAQEIPDSPRSPVSSEGDDEIVSNDGGRYCKCNGPDNHRPMIACDNCDKWYHCECVGLKKHEVDLIDKYVCVDCDGGDLNTSYKVLCRLLGCAKPCDLTANPPSKYCSKAHQLKWGRDMVALCPTGSKASRGGAISRGELKAMVDHSKGDVKAFHALGKKPALPEGSEPVNFDDYLTGEDKGRLARINLTRARHLASIDGFNEKSKLLRMVTARMRKEVDENKDLAGICGWDSLLATNQHQFLAWRDTTEGKKIFESGVLVSKYCDRKHCKTHPQWIKTISVDINEELARLQKHLDKLCAEEETIRDRCKVRAAIQQLQ